MSDIIHKKNYKDRYRSIFCDSDFYSQHQNVFALWKTRFQNLSNVEKATAWAFALCCLRRPKDWFAGKRAEPISTDLTGLHHPLTLQSLFEETPVALPTKVDSAMNLIEAINTLQIKAVPESCFRSLIHMTSQRYPLWVTNEVPTPKELLKLQTEGRRVLSFNENYETWPTALYSGRDFLGFLLHDLIHADHFFHDPLHRDGQLGFYRFAETLLENQDLQKLLQSDRFREGFEYIISDMNSHPVHLFQTLHANVFSEIQDDGTSTRIWQEWSSLQEHDLNSDEIHSINLINTDEFNVPHAKQIEILCIRLGQFSSK